MGRNNNLWLDIVCHIISREWGIFSTWTSFDSNSFQIDFFLTAELSGCYFRLRRENGK